MDDDPDVYVSLPGYTILLIIKEGMVVDAPPIAKWTIGRTKRGVLMHYRRRGALMKYVPKQ